VAIESDDEARRAAEAIIADVGCGGTEAADVFVGVYEDRNDQLWIGRHLDPMLLDTYERWKAGDRSASTVRLVGLMRIMAVYNREREADDAAAHYENATERRAATWAAVGPPPEIASRMTGVGPHGVPLPDDATTVDDWITTRVGRPDALMAFYVDRLRADGWTLDLDNSRPTARGDYPPQCYFSSPTIPGRYLAVLIGPGIHDPQLTRISITEHKD
jgi:hypothetical protein